jgi:hypothetical protein
MTYNELLKKADKATTAEELMKINSELLSVGFTKQQIDFARKGLRNYYLNYLYQNETKFN